MSAPHASAGPTDGKSGSATELAGALTAALTAALAARTVAAFTALLTDDVHWGGTHGGNECTSRAQAGDHYASLLEASVTLDLTQLNPANPGDDEAGDADGDDDGNVFIAELQVRSPDPDEHPSQVAVRLTLRDGLIADIRELDPPTNGDPMIDRPTHEAAIDAIQTGDRPALQQLLVDHPGLASVRLPRRGGRTLLHVATDWPGHYPNVAATIAELVAAGADPDAGLLGEHPETPLHWAASSDDVAAIDALLDAGADINAPGAVIGGGTPIADATAFGQWAAARRLLDRGAATNLFQAAALGLVTEVERHLAVSQPTADDITSSFWGACHGGHIDTAAALLDHGADINWIGYDGLTPLQAAQRSEADAVVRWLEQRDEPPAAQSL